MAFLGPWKEREAVRFFDALVEGVTFAHLLLKTNENQWFARGKNYWLQEIYYELNAVSNPQGKDSLGVEFRATLHYTCFCPVCLFCCDKCLIRIQNLPIASYHKGSDDFITLHKSRNRKQAGEEKRVRNILSPRGPVHTWNHSGRCSWNRPSAERQADKSACGQLASGVTTCFNLSIG